MSEANAELPGELKTALAHATTLDELGRTLVSMLRGEIEFDRFNIGLIDQANYLFHDVFVVGNNVPGRSTGHRRTLEGTVVEQAIAAGDGYYFGDDNLQPWLECFPGFTPVFDSGIRSMMAVPVRDDREVLASLVFASNDARAYGASALSLAARIATMMPIRLLGLSDS